MYDSFSWRFAKKAGWSFVARIKQGAIRWKMFETNHFPMEIHKKRTVKSFLMARHHLMFRKFKLVSKGVFLFLPEPKRAGILARDWQNVCKGEPREDLCVLETSLGKPRVAYTAFCCFGNEPQILEQKKMLLNSACAPLFGTKKVFLDGLFVSSSFG